MSDFEKNFNGYIAHLCDNPKCEYHTKGICIAVVTPYCFKAKALQPTTLAPTRVRYEYLNGEGLEISGQFCECCATAFRSKYEYNRIETFAQSGDDPLSCGACGNKDCKLHSIEVTPVLKPYFYYHVKKGEGYTATYTTMQVTRKLYYTPSYRFFHLCEDCSELADMGM
jgi:hypothetical protein